MGDTFMIDTRSLLQLVDNQPCDSCPEGKIKAIGYIAGKGIAKQCSTCGVRGIIRTEPRSQGENEEDEEVEGGEEKKKKTKKSKQKKDRGPVVSDLNLRTVRAAREAGLDYEGLRLFQATVGLGALPQSMWDDCVKVLEREEAKKGPAKHEAAEEGGTEVDRIMKEMDINSKTADSSKREREGKGGGEKTARRRKKDVPIYEINVRMVKAALAVGLSREALEKLMVTMGLFGNMPQDIWDASVDYIEGEAAARAGREKRVEEPAEVVDYTRLSIRELKALLTSRGVSLAGLVERADLVQACRESEDMGEGVA